MSDPLSLRFRLLTDAQSALASEGFERVDTGSQGRDWISRDGLINASIRVSLASHPEGHGPYYIDMLA